MIGLVGGLLEELIELVPGDELEPVGAGRGVAFDELALGVGDGTFAVQPDVTVSDATDLAVGQLDADTKKEIEKEKLYLTRFFQNCCRNPHIPFTELRFRTTSDKEMCGYAGWEVLRNKSGKIVGLF